MVVFVKTETPAFFLAAPQSFDTVIPELENETDCADVYRSTVAVSFQMSECMISG